MAVSPKVLAVLKSITFAQLQTRVETSMSVRQWNREFTDILRRLHAVEPSTNTQGTDPSTEVWEVNVITTDEVLDILQIAPLRFYLRR